MHAAVSVSLICSAASKSYRKSTSLLNSFRNLSLKIPKIKNTYFNNRWTSSVAAKMTPTMNTEGVEDFEIICSAKANEIHQVTKYRSKSTGLEVVLAEVEGPIVNGYIVLATRAEDDDGLPHTLEHLIFLGSEDYPYKGILDILANKCLASGTNAWTDVDHTCYTLTTAGSQGFCTLLPIYMDHIFHPILSDTAFTTEVYHITGEGTDGGVVYSEIQAKENTGEDKSYTELVRAIYPPESGYHYQTGGVLKNLRESCNNVKVKEFHNKFYNPRNTCLIVCGTVKPEDLFRSLEPVIKKLSVKGVIDDWKKPWLEDLPEISAALEKTIQFPSDEDDEALVTVGFRGPSAIAEIEAVAALRLLFEYLTDSSVGPLQLEFVENDDPLSSRVGYAEMENSRTTFYIEFEAVPLNKTDQILPKLTSVLEKQIDSFDTKRMTDIIKKNFQEELSSMENTPHSSIAYAVIGDFLYGTDEKEVFEKRISSAATIKKFLTQPASFWTNMIRERILNQKWVTINAHPSKEEHAALSKEEETRVNERIENLQETGMTALAEKLNGAILSNAAIAPLSFLEEISVPSTSSIAFHKIKRLQNPEWASDFKCNFYLDDIKSNFVYVTVLMDTTSLTPDQKKYLSLFREALTESPVLLDDGTLLSFEQVVAALSRDFLSYGCGLGIEATGRFKCGSYSHILTFTCQLELEKIDQGFEWIRKILWKTQWSAERLKILANKMMGDVPQLKRKGNRMATTILKDILYKSGSNVKASSLIRQHKFLKELSQSLPKSEEKLKKMFNSIREVITDPGNMTVHIATSVDKLNAKIATIAEGYTIASVLNRTFPFSGNSSGVKRLANDPDTKWMNDLLLLTQKPKELVLGMCSEDSSFLAQASPGITDSTDPVYPILLTVLQYFCQTEGPFYRGIRGAGLAYDFYMDARPSEGLIFFNLYRCTDVVGAYKASMDIIVDHLNGVDGWKEEFLTSAKSSLIFEIIEGEKTPLALASSSLCSYFRNVPEGHSKRMIERISQVTLSELQPVAERFLKPLFTESVNCALVCPNDKVSVISEGMRKLGKKFEIMPLVNNSFLAEWDKD